MNLETDRKIKVNGIYAEQIWYQKIPNQFKIPSKFVILSEKDKEFLVNDDTNPNIDEFTLKQDMQKMIKQFDGACFVKIAGKTAKDCSELMKKVMSVKDFVMLVKMSEYVTEGLCQQQGSSQIVIRRYESKLENGTNQFRVYINENNVIGICQKNTAFLSQNPTINQIQSIKNAINIIIQSIKGQQKMSCVIDLFCSLNGHQLKIFAIQPFHIHYLSLFTQNQLKQHYLKNKKFPLVKTVKTQAQLKQIDLSDYKCGSELKQISNAKDWITFMSGYSNQQQK